MGSSTTPKTTPFDAAVVEIQAKIEEMKTTLATLLRLQAEYGGAPGTVPSRSGNDTEISHDTFFNMTIGDAAKKYLSMVKATKSTADIAEALERGGLKHSSKDFATTVRSILGPREDFTRVPNGDWGLTEWYPGLGRGKKPKAEKPKKKPRKNSAAKARTAKPKAEPKGEPAKPAEKPETPVSEKGPQTRIQEYLASHPNATPREIADSLGLRIQAVTLVLGKLKAKQAAA